MHEGTVTARLCRGAVLAPHTTWGSGGPAEMRAEPASLAELVELAACARERGLPRKRAARQPLRSRTSRSAFREADGAPAAWSLGRCGTKGAREGGAVRPANWIENTAGPTAAQVRTLMDRIVDAVRARFGVRIGRGVRFLPQDRPSVREARTGDAT